MFRFWNTLLFILLFLKGIIHSMGLPVEERMNEHVIQCSYNPMGQITSLTSSLGANLVYERNEFGELTSFRAEQAENHFSSEHQYDSLGFELERMLPGGISQSFAYDNIGRLVDSKTRQSTKVRRERRYHWGKADRLLKTEDSRYGTTSYEYSPTGHLQKATYADGTEEYRLSDKVGNLFDDPDRKLRKYLQGGKIEQSGEWRFKYDKDGQLIEKFRGSSKWWDSKRDRWQYEWNQNGTLKAVKSPHRKRPVQFTYDALGRRICKLASEYTHWVWNGNVPLHEWNTGQTWKDGGWQHYELDLRTWVFEEESFVPMALLLNGKAYSIVTDQLGTPTEAYNAEGEEVWRRRLDMNGKILEEVYNRNAPYSDRIRIPFLFQGQYYDHETELAYNRFRYYSPELGRYISEDPIRFASGEFNFQSYIEDSNLFVDVLGLKSNSALLGRNLGPSPGINHDAHHIVMTGTQDPRMNSLIEQMKAHGIDPDGAQNGIWLARTDADKIPGVSPGTSHKQDGVHSEAYKQELFERLDGKSKNSFKKELKKIKSELKKGRTWMTKTVRKRGKTCQ